MTAPKAAPEAQGNDIEGLVGNSPAATADHARNGMEAIFGPKGAKIEQAVDLKDYIGGRDLLDSVKGGLNSLEKEPTDKQRQEAKDTLAGKVSKLASPEDQAAVKDMGNQLLDGNLDGFKKKLNEVKDPEKRRAMVEELNKNLQGSGTRVQMDGDGNVIVSNDNSNRAIKIGADGRTRVIEATQNADGTTTLGGEVVGGDAGKIMRDMGNRTTNGVNNPGLANGILEVPSFPYKPHRPGAFWELDKTKEMMQR